MLQCTKWIALLNSFVSFAAAATPSITCDNYSTTLGNTTVANTILVFATDSYKAYSVTSGLNGYGIPYQLLVVPSTGVTLPLLNSSATTGNYGGFLILSEVAYPTTSGYASAITTDQFNQIFQYQIDFGVRMVRLDVYPSPEFGVKASPVSIGGCCNTGIEQLISFSSISRFPTSGINVFAGVSTQGLWHYPATIIDRTVATEVANFGPSSDGTFTSNTTAAIVNSINGREQMVFFTAWNTTWSQTSNFLQHGYITWMTRGLFAGYRRTYYQTQVDDVMLKTLLYKGNGRIFRSRPDDFASHVTWLAKMNARLPVGSNYTMELGHNGDYDIEAALITTNYSSVCVPTYAIYPNYIGDPPLEFQKVPGTGTDAWPTTPSSYQWSLACALSDPLTNWFYDPTNRDAFAHVSHTFTHENLNNATYSDTVKEITFNQAWMKQVGLANGTMFSEFGLIPPAITGLHNGDAIQAFMDNNIAFVVGDNSRPSLRNPTNSMWPLISSVAANGYYGLTIMPRWSTPIYYNCDFANCTLQEWIDVSGGSGDFNNLLTFSKTTYTAKLFGLFHDPYMFHQANLRTVDMPVITIGDQTANFSLLMSFTETILQEHMRLVNWPVLTLKHDDLTRLFLYRMSRDYCGYNLAYNYAADGKSILSVTISSTTRGCATAIPITLPATAVTNSSSVRMEKIGNDPTVAWVTLGVYPITLTLSTPVRLLSS